MSLVQQAYSGYSEHSNSAKSSKSLEYDVVASVTSKLKRAVEKNLSYSEFVEALDANRRMWVTIATSIADQKNTYPANLKAQLFYLFEFTTEHTKKVLSEQASVEVLIDINMSILRGLKVTEK